MQVFITNSNLSIAAQELDDKHLNKQITEINQILLSYININSKNPYHNHPINKWYYSQQGTTFLLSYLNCLCIEFYYRFKKYHMGYFTYIGLQNTISTLSLPNDSLFHPAYIKGQKEKDQIIDNTNNFYKLYQDLLIIKSSLSKEKYKWTLRDKPEWFTY